VSEPATDRDRPAVRGDGSGRPRHDDLRSRPRLRRRSCPHECPRHRKLLSVR